MPSVEAAPAYHLQCLATETLLTMSADGECTANTKGDGDDHKVLSFPFFMILLDELTDDPQWYFDACAGDVAIHNKRSGQYLLVASLSSG